MFLFLFWVSKDGQLIKGQMNPFSDRVFTVAFSVSLAAHMVLIIAQFLPLEWIRPFRNQKSLDVVYEYAVAQEELRQIKEKLSRAASQAVANPSPPVLAEQAQIRIPDRPSLTDGQTLADFMPERSSIIDLTNLVDAARGNPVLLSYFGAIREQIQETANRRSWLSGDVTQGLVFVSFVLNSGGSVSDVGVVGVRSVDSQNLRDIALRIVKGAAPFPPFPPSITEPTKTIIVPLEFLLGS